MRWLRKCIIAAAVCTALTLPASLEAATTEERVRQAKECGEILANSLQQEFRAADQARSPKEFRAATARIAERMGTVVGWQLVVLEALAKAPDQHMVEAVLQQCLEDPKLR